MVVLAAEITHDPHVKTCRISRATGRSQRSVLRLIKRHTYHISFHKELHCEEFLNTNGILLMVFKEEKDAE